MVEQIPILVADDSPADRVLIQRALKDGGIPNPVHLTRDGEEALDFLSDGGSRPGVLILDLHLPKMDGMEVLKKAVRIDPEMVIIILTGQSSVKTAVQSLKGGAFEYLEKSKDNLDELVETVRLALKKHLIRLQSHWTVQEGGEEKVLDMAKFQEQFELSNREMDTIKCVCRGDTNKQIGERLFISELTVKGHLKNIYLKLNIHNRATLISKIVSSGFAS
jgi:DNA-binding NarL/FixJ family response regulator